MDLIPDKLIGSAKKVFCRERQLPLGKLIVFILSIVGSGKSKGIDTKSGDFFKSARRSGLWPDARAVHRSAITKARGNVPWEVFDGILRESCTLAYQVWPDDPRYTWHGMSVYAFDGSKYDLPATEEMRTQFDPASGLTCSGRGHYPQCLVSTAYDVLRRLPVARTIVGIPAACEREQAKLLVREIPAGNLLEFDQGYPSYDFIHHLNENYSGYYLFRCPSANSFKALKNFIDSGKSDENIWILPSNKYIAKASVEQRLILKPIKLRAIRLQSPDGTLSVLLTNLFRKEEYTTAEIVALYFLRWGIETNYRDEKVTLEVERFHSRTPNGIRQEILAAAVMTVISRTLIILAQEDRGDIDGETKTVAEPQLKNAIMALASDLAVLVPKDPTKAAEIFQEIVAEIRRVCYYRPKDPRPSAPRVCKKPINKWADGKAKKITAPSVAPAGAMPC